MSDPIRKPDEFPSRSESILSDTIGLEGYSIETPPRSRIETLLIELKEIIGQGGGGSSTAYATSLEITMDEYFVMTATLKNKDGDTLGQVQTVDLPLESVVVNGSYDSINKNVVLTLENGNTVSFSVADLVSGLQTEITSNNKLDADLVDDTNSTHKFATAAQLSQIATNENNILFVSQNGAANYAKVGTNSYINNGITVTVSNGEVTISGTANGTFSLYIGGKITDNIENDNKLISKLPDVISFTGAPNTDNKNRMIFALYNGSTWVYSGSTNDLYHDLTDKVYTHWLLYIPIVSGNQYNGVWKPMIVPKSLYDSGFTNYQPYAMSNAELTAKEQTNENNILIENITSTYTIETGYTLTAYSKVYKQGNHVFGLLSIKKDTGTIPTSQTTIATTTNKPAASYVTGCFCGTSEWDISTTGYVYINPSTGAILARDTADPTTNTTFNIQVDYVIS